MFPRNYFGLFPPFPRENKVFVAMSFDDQFQSRWENVISPAIRNVSVNNTPLEPHRIDTRRIGDSILTEILGGAPTLLSRFGMQEATDEVRVAATDEACEIWLELARLLSAIGGTFRP